MKTFDLAPCFMKSIGILITLIIASSCTEIPEVEYPTGISVMSDELVLSPNWTSTLDFQVTPPTAEISIEGVSSQVSLTLADSPSDLPANYRISRIEASKTAEGTDIAGQYTAFIEDLGTAENYSERARLIIKTKNAQGNESIISSASFNVRWMASSDRMEEFSIEGYASETNGSFITVKVPYNTDLTLMKASFELAGARAYVDGIEQKSGVTANNFSSPVEYRVVPSEGEEKTYTVSICYSDLPVIYINTARNAPILNKEDWVEGSRMLVTNTADRGLDMVYENMNIRGRGNTTWSYPKKPYAIKLDKKASVLGMPKHKRWVLLANWMDRTCMRNAVSFEVARRTALDWTPRGEFVEVVLNGKYLGNYYLCEQIKVDENRVNIAEMESADLSGEAVTGGYLLELDTYYDEVNKFRSNYGSYGGVNGLPVNIKDPDEDVLRSAQFNYIKSYFCDAEASLYANDFAETKAYLEYIDVDSFIDWWLVHELTQNSEPGHPKSSYMHKDRNGKLKAGPVWDFDWGTFMPGVSKFCIKDAIWYHRLFRDPDFVARVKEKWAEQKSEFEDVLNYIDETSAYIKASADANTKQWPISQYVNGDENMSFDESVKRLRSVYEQRLKWLDSAIRSL